MIPLTPLERQEWHEMMLQLSAAQLDLLVPVLLSLARDNEILSDTDWLQIEMAGHGCVSGTLAEWPMLRRVFVKLGMEVYPTMPASQMRQQASDIWEMRVIIAEAEAEKAHVY